MSSLFSVLRSKSNMQGVQSCQCMQITFCTQRNTFAYMLISSCGCLKPCMQTHVNAHLPSMQDTCACACVPCVPACYFCFVKVRKVMTSTCIFTGAKNRLVSILPSGPNPTKAAQILPKRTKFCDFGSPGEGKGEGDGVVLTA